MAHSGTALRRLGPTDIEISPIGLGCMQFSQGRGLPGLVYPAIDQETVDQIVRTAREGGVTWFDTAEMYGRGRSERTLSTALRHHGAEPGDVVIATKWNPLLRTASSIRRTIGARLAGLDGFPVDVHQIHMPHGGWSPIRAQVAEMAGLLRAGKIRSVGVSNFTAKQMEEADAVLRAHGARLTSNQIQANLLHRSFERDGVLSTARRLGVTLIAHTPLAGGLLTGRYHADPDAARARSRTRRVLMGRVYGRDPIDRTRPLVDAMRAIAGAYGVSVAQVALAWLIGQYGDTLVAIPGASKPRQAAESAAAMDLRLSEAERDRLEELSRP